jgi:hypothetical protein
MQAAVRATYETITGRPLAEAPKLSARPPKPASIDPAAPTIDAVDLPSGVLPATTARPVAGRGGPHERRGSIARVLFPIAVVGAVVAAFTVWSDPESSNDSESKVSAAAPEEPQAAAPAQCARRDEAAEPERTEEPAESDPMPSASAETAAPAKKNRVLAAPSAAAVRPVAKPAFPRRPAPIPRAAPKPAASQPKEAVDLFTRRK